MLLAELEAISKLISVPNRATLHISKLVAAGLA